MNSRPLIRLASNHRRMCFAFCVLVAALCAGQPAQALNLLFNSSFETNSGHVIPAGWNRFAPPTAQGFGNYWVEITNINFAPGTPPGGGILYFKEWGASYNGTNNAAGIYQDF